MAQQTFLILQLMLNLNLKKTCNKGNTITSTKYDNLDSSAHKQPINIIIKRGW